MDGKAVIFRYSFKMFSSLWSSGVKCQSLISILTVLAIDLLPQQLVFLLVDTALSLGITEVHGVKEKWR